MAPATKTTMTISYGPMSLSTISVAVMTASTALGPHTNTRVLPHTPVMVPTMTSHHNPASGPRPEIKPTAMTVGT